MKVFQCRFGHSLLRQNEAEMIMCPHIIGVLSQLSLVCIDDLAGLASRPHDLAQASRASVWFGSMSSVW